MAMPASIRQTRPGGSGASDEVRRNLARRYAGEADRYRDALVKFYGEARGTEASTMRKPSRSASMAGSPHKRI